MDTGRTDARGAITPLRINGMIGACRETLVAAAYERRGNTDLALGALTDAARLSGGNSKLVSLERCILAKSGRANEREKC
jgi:ABC-type uncharacterized transport system YnjBCD ATPase subunit